MLPLTGICRLLPSGITAHRLRAIADEPTDDKHRNTNHPCSEASEATYKTPSCEHLACS